MFEILKLIRFRTIAFAAFTMYAVRYFVLNDKLGVQFAGYFRVLPDCGSLCHQ